MDKKILLTVAIVVLVIGAAATYYFTAPKPKKETIKAGTLLGGISTLDIMENKSLGDKYGFNLSVIRFQKTPDIIAALSKGEIDIAVIPAEMAAKLMQTGVNITIFAVDMYQNQAILTLDPTIKTPRDLVGKTIGAVTASGTYKMFKAYMDVVYNISINEEGGTQSDKINIVNVLPGSIIDALVNGDVDAIVIWEPFVSLAVVKYNATIVANYSSLWKEAGEQGDPVMLVWVVRNDLVGTEVLEKLAKAREEAARIWVNYKSYTLDLLTSLYNLDNKVAEYLYDRVKISTVNLDNSLISNIRRVWWLAWKGGYLLEDPAGIGDEAFYISEAG